ncbi:jg26290, partial [Pararge aegeria aegeria]
AERRAPEDDRGRARAGAARAALRRDAAAPRGHAGNPRLGAAPTYYEAQQPREHPRGCPVPCGGHRSGLPAFISLSMVLSIVIV